jgi:hypothetical protein
MPLRAAIYAGCRLAGGWAAGGRDRPVRAGSAPAGAARGRAAEAASRVDLAVMRQTSARPAVLLTAHCQARGPGLGLARTLKLPLWRRPGNPLVLVKHGQGRLKPVRPAKPLQPPRDLRVIQVRMIAAAGADQLEHVGVAALDTAVHDADRLVPQDRLAAVAGLTSGRGVTTLSGTMRSHRSRPSRGRGTETAVGPLPAAESEAPGLLTELTTRK